MLFQEGDTKCLRVALELHSPMFINESLPINWLSNIQSYIYLISIINGNLKHIPCGAFMSHFTRTVTTLRLENLKLESWDSNSLVGLSNLRTLNIFSTNMTSTESNFLRPVDDTLQTLVISNSGSWNPANATGSKGFLRLIVVDFSFNVFEDILGSDSFIGLENCKILYLNSCQITSIAIGAFDHLLNIEVLYLNNNYLKTIAPDLFKTVATLNNPIPRINLQDNWWNCDCDVDELQQLVRKNLLLIDPICVFPKIMEYKTFSQFEYYCVNGKFPEQNITVVKPEITSNGVNNEIQPSEDNFYMDGKYCKGSNNIEHEGSVRVFTPYDGNQCNSMQLNISRSIVEETFRKRVRNRSQLFQFTFLLQTENYTILQIGATSTKLQGYGLVWYHSICPYEVYCVDRLPKFLTIYNTDSNAKFTFCALQLQYGNLNGNDCIGHEDYEDKKYDKQYGTRGISIMAYTVTIFICLCFGATTVYAVIRTHPILLKGNKRILFVKHKHVEAIVLPPKIPLRTDLSNDNERKENNIFTVPSFDTLSAPKFNLDRQKSTRSNKSSAPSYITALQPTEDQLAEWRIKHHFNNDLSRTISSTTSELSTLSYSVTDTPYCSLDESDRIYESLK